MFTAYGTTHRRCCRKRVELIQIINKLLLLRRVGCLYYYISDLRSYKYQINYIIPRSTGRQIYIYIFLENSYGLLSNDCIM